MAPILPESAYLAGGTAIGVHLQHRISRDLDVFFEEPPPIDGLLDELARRGRLVVQQHEEGTLNVFFNATRVQFLDASSMPLVDPAIRVEGMRVAGLNDLMAMKLKVIGDRGEHRDYFDLAAIECDGGPRAETGLAYYLERYDPRSSDVALDGVLRGLAYLDDVTDDPGLPVSVDELAGYWGRRVDEMSRNFGRFGVVRAESDFYAADVSMAEALEALSVARASGTGPHRARSGPCRARTKKRRRCPFDARPGSDTCGIHARQR